MYDITKTRMLLTTAVFASVAAVFAGGANARIPEGDGSGIGVEPVAVVAATGSQYSVMSSRLTGLLRAAQTRDRESGALSGDVSQFSQQASSRLTDLLSSLSPQERSHLKSMTAVCSIVLCQSDEWLAARLGFATRAGSAPTHKFPDGYRGRP
jgi:hypothetical protein